MAEYNVMDSTDYGGKDAPVWMKYGFHFPGYHNAYISITNKSDGEEVANLQFKISPSSFSDARSILYQTMRTMSGYVIMRLGRQPIELSLSGYMLDIKNVLERHDFLEDLEKYIYDKRNYNAYFYNDYNVKLVIEGREYYGLLQGLSFTKTAENPFLYTYQLSYVAYGEKKVYNPDYAVQDAQMLRRLSMEGLYQEGFTASPEANKALSNYLIESSVTGKTTMTKESLLAQMPMWLRPQTDNSGTRKAIPKVTDVNAKNSVEEQLYNMVGIFPGLELSTLDQINKIEGNGEVSVKLSESGDNQIIVNIEDQTVQIKNIRVHLPSDIINTLSAMKQKTLFIMNYDKIHIANNEDLTQSSWMPRFRATDELQEMSEELEKLTDDFVMLQIHNESNSSTYKGIIGNLNLYMQSKCRLLENTIKNNQIYTFNDEGRAQMAIKWNPNYKPYAMDTVLSEIETIIEDSNVGRW